MTKYVQLVFRKRMKLGFPEIDKAEPGDLVPVAVQQRLGSRRIRLWYEAGYIDLADVEEPQPSAEPELVE